MSKLLLGGAGILMFVVYWLVIGINKNVDYSSRRTHLQVQQTVDTVIQQSNKISSGLTSEDPAYQARKAARDAELAQIDRVQSKDRAKADFHVDKAEKQADELESQGEAQPKKIDPLDAYARSK